MRYHYTLPSHTNFIFPCIKRIVLRNISSSTQSECKYYRSPGNSRISYFSTCKNETLIAQAIELAVHNKVFYNEMKSNAIKRIWDFDVQNIIKEFNEILSLQSPQFISNFSTFFKCSKGASLLIYSQ